MSSVKINSVITNKDVNQSNNIMCILIFMSSNDQMTFSIHFTQTFTEIPQILLSNTYIDEQQGLNGFKIYSKDITIQGFTLVYMGLSNLIVWSLNVQWLAIQDSTVFVHYDCLQPLSSQLQFSYKFNKTYNWLTDPKGATFITGQQKINMNNQGSFSMGVTLSSITKTKFTYIFTYVDTEYMMCVHSIFAPPEFLNLYPQKTMSINPTDIRASNNENWCKYPLTPLNYLDNSAYIAGFNSYSQKVNANLRIFIEINITNWVSGNYKNYFLRGYACPTSEQHEESIIRIQYVPQVCNQINNANVVSNSTGSFCQCLNGYYFKDYKSCTRCDYTCLTCEESANHCLTCGTNTNLIDNSCNCKPGTFRGVGPDCLNCDASCLSCQSLSLCTSCSHGYYLDGVLCPKCDINCLTCEEESKQCQTCRANASLDENNKCTCNQGYYMDSSENCQECDSSCLNCQGPLNSQCTECQNGKSMINNYCVCPDGQYIDQEGNCQYCNEECATCSDDSSCLTCKPNLDNYFSEGQCLSCKEKAAMTVDICKYADCTDQVWTKGEQCDDGNNIDRDGCSNCLIDSNYKCINTLLQQSFCYTCPNGCEQCVLDQQNLVLCKQCQNGYYLSNGQCSLCSKNCVTCSSFSQCLTCLVIGYYPTSNGVCPQCEDNAGFYTVINQCQTQCGDSVIAGNEICDDGNLLNGDGCAQNCTLEYGYILQNGKSYKVPVPDSSVCYVNSTSLTNFTVNTGQSDPTLCSFMNVQIENYNASAYYYTVAVVQLSDQVSCLVSFNFNESITSTQLIHFQVPYTIPSSRRFLEYLYREIIITPRNIIIYSQQQAVQAQSVQSTSGTFTLILYFIGPGTVLLGGFECFFRILDILAWINNLYFINIQYPLNVAVFFQNSGWASVQLIPQFTKFNKPQDPYYTESPNKFMDLGVDPLFINNAYQGLSIILVIITCHVLTRIIHEVIRMLLQYYIQEKNKSNNIQEKLIFLIRLLGRFNSNVISHLIQGLNLAFLDLVLAIVMQLLYFRTNYLLYYPIVISLILAVLSIILISFILIISTQLSTKHYKQLSTRRFRTKYGVLFEDINKRSRVALKYCIFNLLRKTLFIINLIIFYNTPIFQTSFSCIISLMNIALILYENPFDNRKALISNFVPDFCIFGLMFISSFLALDDQISQLTADMRFMIGWVMLGLIAISILIQLFYVFQSFIERSLIIYKAIVQ